MTAGRSAAARRASAVGASARHRPRVVARFPRGWRIICDGCGGDLWSLLRWPIPFREQATAMTHARRHALDEGSADLARSSPLVDRRRRR